MERDKMLTSYDDVNMPYSLEAEQAVLGSILIDPSCITQVLIMVKPDYFYTIIIRNFIFFNSLYIHIILYLKFSAKIQNS